MADILKIDSVSKYNKLRGVKTSHPLISVIESSKVKKLPQGTYNFGVYSILLKELKCGELKYGRGNYDYQDGTLVFLAPGQIIGVPENTPKPKGWALLFHPDLIKGTSLGKDINRYDFFSYEVNEALHISEDERKLTIDQFKKIQKEIESAIDHHSKKIIVSSLELLLHYCTRFYDRQFITRDHVNKGVLEKFEQFLSDYFKSEQPQQVGFPTVKYFANLVHLSSNYFGDLVKKETGISPLEHIQAKVIDLAKERIFDIDKSIAEIAYELGFKYPQHFTRLFKEKTGMTPIQYRGLN
ncbi:helix-turn-helix domain-containing protein [Sediminibacterium sp.]|jgi:AraC family transcriptional regulator, transcriptional activator of pobA|uniref:helix-turn-helix domain-containing protein n=1 Tax=Sediminibacterium sp. TaxID=1917865 RepID=UPI003F6F9245